MLGHVNNCGIPDPDTSPLNVNEIDPGHRQKGLRALPIYGHVQHFGFGAPSTAELQLARPLPRLPRVR